jgi:hypothetical protein
MARSSPLSRLLPPVLLFLGFIAGAIVLGAGLDLLGMGFITRWLGLVGTVLLVASFVYSLRKRGHIKKGSPKSLLALHETLSWVGSLLLLVHGGIHANASIPWLAEVAMVVVVASGLTGKYLLSESRKDLAERKAALVAEGLPAEEVERRLHFAALLVGRMQKWRAIHMPLTAVFTALALVHIVATLVMW